MHFKDESPAMELLHGEKRVKHITFLATKVNKMLKYELMKAYAAELFSAFNLRKASRTR